MKQENDNLDRQPFELGAKFLEMKRVKEDIEKSQKEANEGMAARTREKRIWRMTKRTVRDSIRGGIEGISLKLKRIHCLGDFYGRFHPSKSNKGIKRSE